MLDQILAFVQLKKELPHAIGFVTTEVFSHASIPSEVREKLDPDVRETLDELRFQLLRVDNFSSKAQSCIRVLFSGRFEFSPLVKYERRNILVNYSVHFEKKELLINELPPDESVIVQFFNPDEDFRVHHVLIGEQQVTRAMQKMAEAKRDPQFFRLRFFSTVAATVGLMTALGGFATVGYVTWKQHKESSIFQAAGLVGCVPKVIENSLANEPQLAREFNQLAPIWQNVTLSVNKVGSLAELKLKDQLILCSPEK